MMSDDASEQLEAANQIISHGETVGRLISTDQIICKTKGQ